MLPSTQLSIPHQWSWFRWPCGNLRGLVYNGPLLWTGRYPDGCCRLELVVEWKWTKNHPPHLCCSTCLQLPDAQSSGMQLGLCNLLERKASSVIARGSLPNIAALQWGRVHQVEPRGLNPPPSSNFPPATLNPNNSSIILLIGSTPPSCTNNDPL